VAIRREAFQRRSMSDSIISILSQVQAIFTAPLVEIWNGFLAVVPNIMAAVVFLVVGVVLARLLTTITGKLLHKIRLDDITSHIGINEIFARAGFGKSPVYVITFALYWSVMVVFILLATNALNLLAVSQLLQRFALFMPRLVIAVIILFAGLLLAPLVYQVVSNAAATNNLKGGSTLAKSVEAVVIVFSVLIALEQIGVAMNLIISTVQILMMSLGLAFAIAFGLGAKDLAGEFLRGFFKREK